MLLFEEAPPPLPSPLDVAMLAQVGEKIALLHATADGLDTDLGVPEIQCGAFLEERVYYTLRFLSQTDSDYLVEVSRHLGPLLERLPRTAPDFGLCHADLVMSNLRMTADGTITLFDFGNALRTWRAFELAIVYWSLGNRHGDGREQLQKAFLQGYASIRPLPQALPEHLPIMGVVRQIGFLGGNCATLPLRLGTEPFESDFLEKGMARLRELVEESGILSSV